MTKKRRSTEEVERLAHEIAKMLRADRSLMQEHAAVKLGIAPRTYWSWLAGSKERDVMFQRIVSEAVHDQAKANFEDYEDKVIGSDGRLTPWSRWALEKRYRTIFGDLATVSRMEHSGPDGKAIEVSSMSEAEIERRLREIASQDRDEDE